MKVLTAKCAYVSCKSEHEDSVLLQCFVFNVDVHQVTETQQNCEYEGNPPHRKVMSCISTCFTHGPYPKKEYKNKL